jgi:paraquat-inducible protein B
MKTLNARLPGLLNATEQSLLAATTSFNSAKATLHAVENLTEPDAALNAALHDISEAARGVKTLAETLERHPDMLLYGRKKSEQAP